MKTREIREGVSDRFFKGTARSYDRCVAWTTLFLDERWKRYLMRGVPQTSKRILDLACGTGLVLKHLHRRCPDAALVGVDFTPEYIELAKQRFEGKQVDLSFINSNAETMELDGTFDAIVSCYIPKYVDPDALLERVSKHVRPGTAFAVHDFGYPRGFPRVIWRAWMWILNKIGTKIWPDWKAAFDEKLYELIVHSKWHRTYPEALERHGWTNIEVHKRSFRTAYCIFATKA